MASKKQRDGAWHNAKPIPGKNSNFQRRDAAGNTISRSAYGKTSPQGWEVDHKKPSSKGGSDNPRNLQAMQTSENRRKGNSYPYNPRKKKT